MKNIIKNKKIAITGGIGSGKSLALKCLQEWGFPVFSCDEIYKEIIEFPKYVKQIEIVFPNCISNGKIDRKMLANEVFSNAEKLQKLNEIAHPLIMETLLEKMGQYEGLVFAEVPLLFEGNYESLFDSIIVIMRNNDSRIESVIKRDGTTKEKVCNRINAQFDYASPEAEERLHDCEAFVIENNGSIEDLKRALKMVLKIEPT